MDFSWLDGFVEAKNAQDESANALLGVHQKLISHLARIWDQEDRMSYLMPADSGFKSHQTQKTLRDYVVEIDRTLGDGGRSPRLKRLAHLDRGQFENVCCQFLSGVLNHLGDTERCAAFILRYKSVFSLFIVHQVAQIARDNYSKANFNEVLKDSLESFINDECSAEERMMLVSNIQEKVMMNGFLLFAASYLVSSRSVTTSDSNSSEHLFDKETTQILEHISELTYIPQYQNSIDSDCRIETECYDKNVYPCKHLFLFCREYLKKGTVSASSQVIGQAAEQVLRHYYLGRMFHEYHDCEELLNDYLHWETDEASREEVSTMKNEQQILSATSLSRGEYELRLQKNVTDVGLWVEYIMWEFSSSRALYGYLISKRATVEVAQYCLLRPLCLCEKALTCLHRVNMGKALFFAQMRSYIKDPNEKADIYGITWERYSSTLKNLLGKDQVNYNTLRQSIQYDDQSSLKCRLTVSSPLWVQYISLMRLLISRLPSSDVETKAKASFLTLLGSYMPHVLYRALRSHPTSTEILTECVLLVHFFQRTWVPFEGKSPISVSTSTLTIRLVYTKLLSVMITSLNQKSLCNENRLLAERSADLVHFFRDQNKYRIKHPTSRSNNLVIFFYLMGCQAVSGSPLYPSIKSIRHGSRTSADFGMPTYIVDTLQALSTLTLHKLVTDVDKDEILNALTFLMLAVRTFIQRITKSAAELPGSHLGPSFFMEIAKKLTSILEESLNGYPTSCYLDVTLPLYQTYGGAHTELGDLFRKAMLEKVHHAHKAFAKARSHPSSNNSTEFEKAILAFSSVENKLFAWEHTRHFDNSQGTSVTINSAEHEIVHLWHDIMHEAMAHWTRLSDECRVTLQKMDIDLWIASMGEYTLFVDPLQKAHGTKFLCMRNIPSPFEGAESEKAHTATAVPETLTRELSLWLQPFSSVGFPSFQFQKNQVIVVAEMQTAREAAECAAVKNRTEWMKGGRRINVQQINSEDELRGLCASLERKRRHSDRTSRRCAKARPLESPKEGQRSNEYFNDLFSNGT